MHFNWLSVLLALDLICFPVIALWAAWQVLKLRRTETLHQQKIERLIDIERLLSELQENIESSDTRLSISEEKMGRQYQELLERLDRLELQVHSGSVHMQAMRLLESGMSPDKLISVCGLSRDEAELLRALHEASNER